MLIKIHMSLREEMFRKLKTWASLFSVIRWQFVAHFRITSGLFYKFFYKLRLVFLGVNCILPIILSDG